MSRPPASEAKPRNVMAKNNPLHAKIQETAQSCFIHANDEFLNRAVKELEASITPEFLEKIRAQMLKESKSPAPTVPLKS